MFPEGLLGLPFIMAQTGVLSQSRGLGPHLALITGCAFHCNVTGDGGAGRTQLAHAHRLCPGKKANWLFPMYPLLPATHSGIEVPLW